MKTFFLFLVFNAKFEKFEKKLLCTLPKIAYAPQGAQHWRRAYYRYYAH